MQFLLSPSKARGSDASSARGSRGVDDVGEIIICCIDDGEDGDEVGLWGKGGDPISIVCVKSLKGCCFSRSGMLGRVSVDVKGELGTGEGIISRKWIKKIEKLNEIVS